MSFIKTASRPISDIKTFLRESAGGNGIKYSAEKGARHILYFPYITSQEVDEATGATVTKKTICAISGAVHEWVTSDNKFKSTVCLKDIIRKDDNGNTLNDGSCPFCDRIGDAWNIYNYRKEQEDINCKLTGEQRKTHLEKANSSFRDERKAKEVRNYMYILVIKFKLNEQGKESLGSDGLPEYELKVMKLSSSRVDKIQQQITNSGAELAGSELIFEYPNVDDKRLQVSQSTVAPVFPNNMIVTRYPDVLNKINQDVAKFEWEGIEKSFPEWAGMTSQEAKSIMDNAFEEWDKYVQEKIHNPNAKYLEYVAQTPSAVPNLNGVDSGVTGALPGGVAMPSIPNIPNIAQPAVAQPAVAQPTVEQPTMAQPTVAQPTVAQPTVAAQPTVEQPGPTIPGVAIPGVAGASPADPNAVFGGAAAPSITI